MRTKRKEGEYIPLEWEGGDAPWEIVAGHVSDDMAWKAFSDYAGIDDQYRTQYKFEHGYCRFKFQLFGRRTLGVEQDRKRSGSFKVTFIIHQRNEVRK